MKKTTKIIIGVTVAGILLVGAGLGHYFRKEIKNAISPPAQENPDNPDPKPPVSLTHTVKFIIDGEEYTQTVADGEKIVLDETFSTEKEGYTFLGFSIDGENVIDLEIYEVTSDITLTALFEEDIEYITNYAGFTFEGETITGYSGNDEYVKIPSSYSLGDIVNKEKVFNDFFSMRNFIYSNSILFPVSITANGQTKSYDTESEVSRDSTLLHAESLKLSYQSQSFVEGDDVQVTQIGNFAFENNTKIRRINISEGIDTLKLGAFGGCSSLENIKLPNSLIKIEDNVFANCANIATIELPSNVESIGTYCFQHCSSLNKLKIPASVSEIGENIFLDCPNITKIDVDKNNSIYDSREDCNAIIETASNTLLAVGGNYTIPANVKALGPSLFYYATFTTFVVPEGIEKLETGVFSCCKELISIVLPNSLKEIGDYVFNTCSKLTNITIPDGVTSIGRGAFQCCSELTSMIIPSSVESIGEYAFDSCTVLEKIIIHGETVPSLASTTNIFPTTTLIYVDDEAFDQWTSYTSQLHKKSELPTEIES